MEAFSDGVIAILITVMVLELKTPHGTGLEAFKEPSITLAAYAVSFIYLGIYWNNHHHMLHAVKHVNGASLWANHHLLFWLSLVPFMTKWVGETGFAPVPVALYSANLMLAGISYYILAQCLARANADDSEFADALGKDVKGKVSVLIYAIGVGLAFVKPAISCALIVLVALMWLIPDTRFMRAKMGGSSADH